MTIQNITKDAMYDAVTPDDFGAMLELDRFGNRSTALDRSISATDDHYWDPLDPKYIDFTAPFDLENEPLLPESQVFPLQAEYISNHLKDPKQRTAFINEMAAWQFSQMLYGEQGALSLSSSLVHVLKDPGAQEYAANQAREEARHVTAFAMYIKARWGKPRPVAPSLKALLTEIIGAPEVYKKIIGMQLVGEGMAMSAYSTSYIHNRDPLARKLLQLIMTDEAFHHKFGKIWADRTVPKLNQDELNIVEDWAAHCFQSTVFNIASQSQLGPVFAQFGMDPQLAMQAMQQLTTGEYRRKAMREPTNIFRALVKTLLKAGLITERTRAFYASFVDLDELNGESDRMVGDDIAEAGIKYLHSVNSNSRLDALVAVAAE